MADADKTDSELTSDQSTVPLSTENQPAQPQAVTSNQSTAPLSTEAQPAQPQAAAASYENVSIDANGRSLSTGSFVTLITAENRILSNDPLHKLTNSYYAPNDQLYREVVERETVATVGLAIEYQLDFIAVKRYFDYSRTRPAMDSDPNAPTNTVNAQ